jgi:hypothetical protein
MEGCFNGMNGNERLDLEKSIYFRANGIGK